MGDSPSKPNSTIFQILREDNGKVILHVTPNMTLRIQCFKSQDFVFSYHNKVLFIKDRKDTGEKENYDDKVYKYNLADF